MITPTTAKGLMSRFCRAVQDVARARGTAALHSLSHRNFGHVKTTTVRPYHQAMKSEPMAIEAEYFRSVLGHLPTGVTVITGHGASGPIGMACNSVTSVSLDPPLVSLCVATSSNTWPSIRASGHFCVNVMAGHHEQATRAFSAKGVDRFSGVELVEHECGPALSEAVAWIGCNIHAEYNAGDHVIVVGAVRALEAHPGREALVYFRGIYSSVAPP